MNSGISRLFKCYTLMGIGFLVMLIPLMIESLAITSVAGMIGAIVGMIGLILGIVLIPIGAIANTLFLAFAFLMGMFLHPALFMSGVATSAIVLALVLTVALFVLLSVYTIVSGKDFSGIGGFLFIALILLILAGVANIFIGCALLDVMISWVAVVIFSGFILYDTSTILRSDSTTTAQNALNMFLNVINLFMNLLNILKD